MSLLLSPGLPRTSRNLTVTIPETHTAKVQMVALTAHDGGGRAFEVRLVPMSFDSWLRDASGPRGHRAEPSIQMFLCHCVQSSRPPQVTGPGGSVPAEQPFSSPLALCISQTSGAQGCLGWEVSGCSIQVWLSFLPSKHNVDFLTNCMIISWVWWQTPVTQHSGSRGRRIESSSPAWAT